MEKCQYCERNTIMVYEFDMNVCLLCLYDEIYNSFVIFCKECQQFGLLYDDHFEHELELNYNTNLDYLVNKYSILFEYDIIRRMNTFSIK